MPDLGWITLLGKGYCARMGGINTLRQATAHIPDATVAPLPGEGAMVRLSDAPRLGDLCAEDALDDYRALGKVLSPLRNREILMESLVVHGIRSRDYPDVRAQWIDRFFPQ